MVGRFPAPWSQAVAGGHCPPQGRVKCGHLGLVCLALDLCSRPRPRHPPARGLAGQAARAQHADPLGGSQSIFSSRCVLRFFAQRGRLPIAGKVREQKLCGPVRARRPQRGPPELRVCDQGGCPVRGRASFRAMGAVQPSKPRVYRISWYIRGPSVREHPIDCQSFLNTRYGPICHRRFQRRPPPICRSNS